ncbi:MULTISPECIES: hypothetical protein [unclassified Thalassospira]|uniref:hypothetical protein n=1 Tax=unclassified Thalassospira TaxID=2648997 RepID=UPI000EE0BBDF|nr:MULTISPECIES: hypothetical protein [unclassified Thalassospira]HAI33218.1 hypothetical protein [Thalassospira sp.]|tara:strand:+ start:225 stop:752 length:528 start_codon:yes stop_codon:yes gene_type:complete
MSEWEVRSSCRVWRGRYVIRGDVDRIANDIVELKQNRFPGLETDKVSLRVVTMAVMSVLAEECCEDGVTAAELSFLLTTCLGMPISPTRIESEMAGLSGLVWTGEWGGENLYVMEKRGLRFFENARARALSKDGNVTPKDREGVAASEAQDAINAMIDPVIINEPAAHARYRVVS